MALFIAPDAAQIAAWKAQYGAVYALELGERTAYVRQPLPADLAHAHRSSGGDPFRLNSILFDNCWLAGEPDLKTDDGLYTNIVGAMAGLARELLPQLLPGYKKPRTRRSAKSLKKDKAKPTN